jgi:hypothetical protein
MPLMYQQKTAKSAAAAATAATTAKLMFEEING